MIFKWSKFYQKSPPVGFMLREKYHERWVRVHSLPQSRRYPDGNIDEIEICKRNLDSARDVLGTINVTLYQSIYSDHVHKTISLSNKWSEKLTFKFVEYKKISENDEDPYYLMTFGAKFDWDEEIFQQIILDVAKENISNISFFSQETRGVFSPYDGGADLFYFEAEKKEQARKNFKTWLSTREDGL